MTEPRSDEAMDACRRDPADLQWPEMHQLAAQLSADPELKAAMDERLDQDDLIASRLKRVAWPGSDRARLMAQIQAQLASQPEEPVVVEPVSRPVDSSASSSDGAEQGGRLRSRVRRYRRFVLVASALVLAVVAWVYYPTRWSQVGAQELASWALREWQPRSEGWRRMAVTVEGQGSVSNWLRKSPARWQPLETHLDRQSAVYEIPTKKSGPSRLFVLHADHRVAGLPSQPPQQPQTVNSGWLFAAWQEDSRVYVLSVPGSLKNYWDLVHQPAALSSHGSRSGDAVRN